ncbi:MAG: nuclear transport factor 2 family protein [Pseudomonadota bacterium]
MAFGPALDRLVAQYLSAYARHDAAACAALFTENARLDHPYGTPGLGRPGIARLHDEWFAEEERNKKMWVVEAEAAGPLGHALLGWSAEVGPPNAQPPEFLSGVSLCLLRAEGTGWLIHRLALVPAPGS